MSLPDDLYVVSPVNPVHNEPPHGCTCVWLPNGAGEIDLAAEIDDCPAHGEATDHG